MPRSSCEECWFAHPAECPALKECRRFPPQVSDHGPIYLTDTTFYSVAQYPLVYNGMDVCGEFKERPKDFKGSEGQF